MACTYTEMWGGFKFVKLLNHYDLYFLPCVGQSNKNSMNEEFYLLIQKNELKLDFYCAFMFMLLISIIVLTCQMNYLEWYENS